MGANDNRSYPTMAENALHIIKDQIYPLVKEETTIGRSLENDVVIQNDAISCRHARILYQESQFVIYDLHSTGGVFVNGEKVDRMPLYSGDSILLASEELEFMLKGASVEGRSDQSTQILP